MDFFHPSPQDFGGLKIHLLGVLVHLTDQSRFDLFVPSLNEIDRVGHVSKIAAPVDIVVTRPGAGVHLKVKAVGMWIVAADVVKTGPQLECSFQCGFEARELTATDERPKVIDARFYLARRIDPRESLLPIDLHQREVPEGPHLPIRLGEMRASW